MVLGVLFVVGGSIVVLHGEALSSLPLRVLSLGAAMVAAGAYLYYLGAKEAEKVP